MKKFILVVSLFVLFGAGCAKAPSDNSVTYEKYQAGDTGITFDVPVGTKVYENVNGFEDIWKYEYDENSYFVAYNEYKGQAIYSYWETLTNDEFVVVNKENYNVYINNNDAIAEAFQDKLDPAASILVSGQQGEELLGNMLASDDIQFTHLMQSVTLNGNPVF